MCVSLEPFSSWHQQQANMDSNMSVCLCVSWCDAGVVVYDFEGPEQTPRVLLIREKKGLWNMPAGEGQRL